MIKYDGLDEFLKHFSSEEACIEALFNARWPNGFRCPRCTFHMAYPIKSRKLYQCACCDYQVSLTAGTIFERTRTPLSKWFIAIFMMAGPKGINAKELQTLIRVTYKTAWSMMMKIRSAMHREVESELLTGIVQVQSKIYGRRPFQPTNKPAPYLHPVIAGGGSLNEHGEPARIKIVRLPKLSDRLRAFKNKIGSAGFYSTAEPLEADNADIVDFKYKYVDPNAVDVRRDRRFKLPKLRYLHMMVLEASEWIRKTFNGVSVKHLQFYLDQFCFRYNVMKRAAEETPDMSPVDHNSSYAFFSVLHTLRVCTSTPAVTYAEIISNPNTTQRNLAA